MLADLGVIVGVHWRLDGVTRDWDMEIEGWRTVRKVWMVIFA